MSDELIEPMNIIDTFCEMFAKIERVGPCRRLVFATVDRSDPSCPTRVVIEKLVLPAEALLDIAQAIVADRQGTDTSLRDLRPLNAVSH